MPTAARAIAAVESQPRLASNGLSVNWPITRVREAISMIMTMIGTAATPLITALQNSALIGSSGLKLSSAPINVAAAIVAVERRRARGAAGQPDRPAQRLAHRVGRAARQHRDRQQAGADDPQREDGEGERAGDRAQRLGRLR